MLIEATVILVIAAWFAWTWRMQPPARSEFAEAVQRMVVAFEGMKAGLVTLVEPTQRAADSFRALAQAFDAATTRGDK